MNAEDIEKFLKNTKLPANKYLKISFKKRDAVYGVFIPCNDAAYLQSKNLWRIVTFNHLKDWQASKDINLSRIFNGSDFSKLSVE